MTADHHSPTDPNPDPTSDQNVETPSVDYATAEASADSQSLLLSLQQILADPENQEDVCAFLDGLSDTEIALLLESFPAADRDRIWVCVPQSLRGEVLAEVGGDARANLMAEMPAEDVTLLAQDLPPEDVTELLQTVTPEVKEAVIESLDVQVRDQVETLQGYTDNQVGRYMNPGTTNVKQDVTLETVQRFVRINHLLDEQSQELMVTDADNHLVGSLSLVDLVKQPQEASVDQFMYMPTYVTDTMDTHEAATLLRSKELNFVPVINEAGVLVGQLNSQQIMELTRDDSDATLLGMSGVKEEDELFAPIRSSAKSRGVWLGINLATAFLAAWVIGQFEAVLSQVVALAVLMPVVASMGGIAGSQTLTVVIRGMAMGQIGGNNRWWLMQKELWVGMIGGFIWGSVVAIVAQLWFEDVMITLVIGLAILINMTVANVAGISVPLVLKRMGIDPALSGAVILTTVTDVVGFMSFLGLATLLILTV
ncbi:MAG: magnesium transporter [Hydrogenovibrio sp.]|uniref:magnesium transporter n=1 Tax=Hydrogenovibrio sp. TaxID=2065821 RepID=UPI0028705ABC|nr:magnesium transporter [Hydrogenovibrio sp.]MDR9499764.1 magnesium transporter [Hydrogenovibrio sp.]